LAAQGASAKSHDAAGTAILLAILPRFHSPRPAMDGVRGPHIMTGSTDNKRREKMTHARSEYKDFMSLTPDAYAAVLALGQVAANAGMDKQLLELVKLRASQINGCAFFVPHDILLCA